MSSGPINYYQTSIIDPLNAALARNSEPRCCCTTLKIENLNVNNDTTFSCFSFNLKKVRFEDENQAQGTGG